MPHSMPNMKPALWRLICKKVGQLDTIVDVGAGDGETGKKLAALGYEMVDAIEPYKPWVEKFGLYSIYKNVIIKPAVEIGPDWGNWSCAILSDVLEHMFVKDALKVLNDIKASGRTKAFVIVPFNSWQGAWGGCKFEIHRQPDLSPKMMGIRYPMLRLVEADQAKGLYEL